MKLPRHAIARNTVGELQSLRQQQISPREAAGAELAKFGAIGAGVDAASEVTRVMGAAKAQRENEEAKVEYAIANAEKKAAYTLLTKDPDLEAKMEADDNYFDKSVAEIEANYISRFDGIKNPRIKDGLREAQKIELIKFRAEAEGDYNIYQTKVGKNKTVRAGRAAELANMPEEARAIYDAGSKYFSEAEKAANNIRLHNQEVDRASDDLMSMADDAYELGGIDAANKVREGVLNNDNLDDEVQEQALSKINTLIVNREKTTATQRAAYELAEQQKADKERITFEYNITPATDDATLNEFADAQKLTYPQRRQLFEIRNKKLSAGQSVEFGNPNEKAYRDGLDTVTQGMMVEGPDGEPVPMPLDQQFEVQIAMVADRIEGDGFVKGTNAIGTNLTNSMIMDAASPEPEVNLRGLQRYGKIIANNPSTKLAFDNDTDNFYQAAFASAKNQGGSPEAYATAAKEQRAIHLTKAQGIDSVSIATKTFNDYIAPDLFEDVGDTLEQLGIDIPGIVWDSEIQFGAQFQSVLLRAGQNISLYQQSTEGRIDPTAVKQQAYQRAVGTVGPNFLNDGVPSGGQTFLTNKGLQEDVSLKPQLSVNAIDGADTPEGSKALRSLMKDDYVEGGTGLNGKKVKYNGKEYTLRADKPSVATQELDRFHSVTGEIDIPTEDGVIYIQDIEFFTGQKVRSDDNGKTLADLRYKNIPIYDTTGKNFEAWNGYTSDGYFVPAGKTDISGGPTRADVNPRIKQLESPDF